MRYELARARAILKNEGMKKLAKRSTQYLTRDSKQAIYLFYPEIKLRKISQQEIKKRMTKEETLDDILDTALDICPGKRHYQIKTLQLRKEFKEFNHFVNQYEPETIVEIGTYYGGTLYAWSRYLDSVSEIVSIDLPHDVNEIQKQRSKLYKSFSPSKDINIFYGNSHEQETFQGVASVINEADMLFIDGDHTYNGVKEDFEMYTDLMSEGGLVAFHDIIQHADSEKEAQKITNKEKINDKYITVGSSNWGVARFWEEISPNYKSKEFRSHPQQMGKGIGVIEI